MSRPGTPGVSSQRQTPRSGSSSPEPLHIQAAGNCTRTCDSNMGVADAANKNNEQQKSKDNIKVAVRIRPISEKEDGRGDHVAWATDNKGGVGLLVGSTDKINVKYAYDLVFNSTTTNEQVFEQVARSTLEPVLSGISGTVFAYGVTSSGKTHTMMGTTADPGVVPRSIQALFEHIGRDSDRLFTVTFSMMEIYCEMLNDLLDPTKLNLDVQERELPGGKGMVLQVKGLTASKVSSAEAALALIQHGLDNRKVGATAYNDQSSRSHTLCRFLVEGAPRPAGHPAGGASSGSSSATATGGGGGGANTCTSAWLTLVDLAGSEGAKAALSKDQATEARDINRSLLTLGKVVFELGKGTVGGHVPFRDSLLTRLLKPSLTGTGAKVAIICNVTPASSQSEETWNTLRFADGAKRIKVSAVRSEVLDVAAVVAQYQREVESLKAQLSALTGAAAAGGDALSPEVLQAMQTTLAGSSSANFADQLADQEAQLRYLQEINAMVAVERDQLLAMNRQMTALLVAQFKQTAATAVTAAAASDVGGAAGAPGIDRMPGCAGAISPPLKRCLSYESLPFYGSWLCHSQVLSSKATMASHQDLQQLALGMGGLIRLTQDDLPDLLLTSEAGSAADGFTQEMKMQQQQQHQGQQQMSSERQAADVSADPGAALAASASASISAMSAAAAGPVIYFPGNRRTSKTLALAAAPADAVMPSGAMAAAWLCPVVAARAAAAAAAAVGCSALSEVVEAHRMLGLQEARLQLLLQHLQDKKVLLTEARQLQESQTLQLRLTITAADRALLRDKLAEAEQQLASCQCIIKECEAEKEELYDTAYSLFGRVEKLSEQNHTAAAELRQLRSQLAACSPCKGPLEPANSISNIGRWCSASQGASPVPASGAAAAAAAAAASTGQPMPPRPKSANAVFGYGRHPGVQAAGLGANNNTPKLSSIPSISAQASGSISNTANNTALSSNSPVPYVGVNNLNPICLTSPFSRASNTDAGAGSCREADAAACGTVHAGTSGSGSSTNPMLFSSNALLATGSRIPLPPCLQQRPNRIATSMTVAEDGSGNSSSILLRLANIKTGQATSNIGSGSCSRLPAAPSGAATKSASLGGSP